MADPADPAGPKHTPGPWRLAKSGLTVLAGPADPEGGYPQGRPVASALPAAPLAERGPNARLIAAAPDLLAACERVLGASTGPARALLAAAVRKARGG